MNTCPTCPNDLVCHDQGECLRPTPETDAEAFKSRPPFYFVPANFARRLERERNEARELLASEKSTRNAIIAKGIETERQLAEAREETARLREALEKIKRRHCIMGSTGDYRQGQLDALEVTRTIAGLALTQTNT